MLLTTTQEAAQRSTVTDGFAATPFAIKKGCGALWLRSPSVFHNAISLLCCGIRIDKNEIKNVFVFHIR